MNWFERIKEDHWHGIHLAINVFIATTILWIALRLAAGVNPIWGITAMLSATEPIVKSAARASRGVIRNTIIGCVVGLLFVMFGRGFEWSLPIAMMVAVLLSLYVFRVKGMWQHAPLTAAIVIAANIANLPDATPFEAGLKRVGEVLFGCVVGLIVSWFMSFVWRSPEPTETSSDAEFGGPSCG